MLTKLKEIILRENLTATKIYVESNKLFYPGLHMYQLSNIISGKNTTAYVATYVKILITLNALASKQYRLEDIIENNIVDNDLK